MQFIFIGMIFSLVYVKQTFPPFYMNRGNKISAKQTLSVNIDAHSITDFANAGLINLIDTKE